MKTSFNKALAKGYSKNSQIIRVLSENWVGNEIFCPSCGSNINHYESGKPVADFFCPYCKEDYELKSKKDTIGKKIVNGAFGTMIERLKDINNPNFFILNYHPQNYEVVNFLVIPKHFFVPEIIEKRKPLSPAARRAGWVGCNILIKDIPNSGKIYYIKNRKIESKNAILDNWRKTLFLRETKEAKTKGWVLDIMNCIDKLGKKEFALDDIYAFESPLSSKHPDNKHIKDKIRQQLQLLRDKGYLDFKNRGKYILR